MTAKSPTSRILHSITGRNAGLLIASLSTIAVNLGSAGVRLLVQGGLARWLGPVSFGTYTLLRNWGSLLGRLPNRGYNLALVRSLPRLAEAGVGGTSRALVRQAAFETLRNALILLGVSMAISAIVLGDSSAETMVGLSLIVTTAMGLLLRSSLQGMYKHVLGVTYTELVLPTLLGVLTVALGLAFGKSITIVLFALIGASLIVIGLEIRSIKRALPPDTTDETTTDPATFRQGTLPLFVGQLGIAAQEVSYLLIVGATLGAREAGLYAVATRIAQLARMGNSAVESLIGPDLGRLGKDGREAQSEIQEVVDRGIRLSIFFTGTACLGIALTTDFVLSIFGDGFADARNLVWVMLFGMVLNAATGPTGYLVSMTGSELTFGYVMLGHAIVGAGLALTAAAAFNSATSIAAVSALTTISWNLWFVWVAGRRLGVWSFPGGQFLARHQARTSDV